MKSWLSLNAKQVGGEEVPFDQAPEGAPIGPIVTSTETYLNARGGAVLIPRPVKLDREDPALRKSK